MKMSRVDKDSLGEIKVPIDAYYGAFTARAIKQYKVTGQKAHINLINSYVMIKRSAAIANVSLKILDQRIGNAIVSSCDEILDGKFLDQFLVDSINSGAGTAFNMNTNEVIANRALEIIGDKKGNYEKINPNDHVNMSQSSNDTFPTAMNMSVLINMKETVKSLAILIKSLKKKGQEFSTIIKIGRTHLMDAIPVTLGSEFDEHAYALEQAKEQMEIAMKKLEFIGIGGTAVGTGANTPKGYKEMVVNELSKISGLNLKNSLNLYYSLQSKFDIANCSSSLRNLAIELTKLANDIRLMACGPVAGFSEIMVPAVHAGSSIMPGKVNPSLAECMNMICFQIIGNDVAVAMSAQAGQFELNVMLPGMLKSILDSTDMLINFMPIFARNLVEGITANEEKISQIIGRSPILITLLNPYIGYLKSAEIYKEAMKTGINIKELVLSKKLMSEEELENALSVKNILGSQ
ncbi:MAG: aspartate ammonia-lyase [Nitrososphaeraceae archaeon]|nr:aspartate ammonia-lyase [Nitrososphaeraceae archaeon]